MDGAMFPPCWPVFGRDNVGNGDLLQKDLCQHTAPMTVVLSAPIPMAGHCQPMPLAEMAGYSQAILAQSLVGSLLLSLGSWCVQILVCALQESVSPVLWKFCNQIPRASKVKLPGGSQSFYQIPRLGTLLWALELLQQYENFFNITVLWFVASSPISWWQIDGEIMERVEDFYFLGLQNHCRWWLQPWN